MGRNRRRASAVHQTAPAPVAAPRTHRTSNCRLLPAGPDPSLPEFALNRPLTAICRNALQRIWPTGRLRPVSFQKAAGRISRWAVLACVPYRGQRQAGAVKDLTRPVDSMQGRHKKDQVLHPARRNDKTHDFVGSLYISGIAASAHVTHPNECNQLSYLGVIRALAREMPTLASQHTKLGEMNMMRLLAAMIVAVLSSVASANIVYNLNRTVGAGSAVGFIETDGTIGILSAANIVDYSLTLTSLNLAGGSPQTISKADELQGIVFGSALSASLTELFYDFSVPNNAFFFQSNLGTLPFYGMGTVDVCPAGCVGEYIGWGLGFVGPAEQSARSGNVSFATTPEPTTMALLGLGLFGLAFGKRKQA